jgi:predicted AlkP superfamily phosphohydrolase/phosphomutase
MNKDRLKLIVKNLELLVDSLKSELYSDSDPYDREVVETVLDYDEVYSEDGD